MKSDGKSCVKDEEESKTGGQSRHEIIVYAGLSVLESCQMQEEVYL